MNTFQSSEYKKSPISNDHKTGVGAICVDDDFIYYSTYETCENGSLMYPLKKYNQKEKENMPTCVVGFDRIRGIAKDKENNIYVVDSLKWRVVKFDSDLNPEQKTCPVSTNSEGNQAYPHLLQEPYGILVTDKYVFVCASKENSIYIFHPNLNLLFEIKNDDMLLNQTDITMLNGKYFVTTHSAIVVFNINFENETYNAHRINGMHYNGHPFEMFSKEKKLRGICSDNKHLYVAETNGRLLLLDYNETKKQLHCIDSIQCSPIVVAHHNGTVYFCQKDKDGKFFIAKVIANYGTDYEDIFQV